MKKSHVEAFYAFQLLAMPLVAEAMDRHGMRVKRCEPSLDEQTLQDGNAVCSVCKRRLTLDDIGGGPPGGPFKPLPECKGAT